MASMLVCIIRSRLLCHPSLYTLPSQYVQYVITRDLRADEQHHRLLHASTSTQNDSHRSSVRVMGSDQHFLAMITIFGVPSLSLTLV
jgi:hypothetical protein